MRADEVLAGFMRTTDEMESSGGRVRPWKPRHAYLLVDALLAAVPPDHDVLIRRQTLEVEPAPVEAADTLDSIDAALASTDTRSEGEG